MRLSALPLAVVLTIAFATNAECADKVASKLQMQTDFISDAQNTINLCNKKYREFVAIKRMNEYAYEQGLRADDAMSRLEAAEGKDIRTAPSTKLEKTPEYHALCIEKSKEMLLPRAKGFIASFKTSRQQSEAKAMVAQWMTAIDSTGKEIGPSEKAKFDTLSNGVLIELQ